MAYTVDEKMALIAILKGLVESGDINEAELEAFEKVALSRGFHDYSHIFERVDREIASDEDLNQLLARVTSPDSRGKILKTALDLVRSDGMISGDESRFIKDIAHAWKVNLREISRSN